MERSHLRSASIVVVSIYLVLAALWLFLTRRIRAEGLGKLFRSYFRAAYAGELHDFHQETQFCWVAPVPAKLLSDKDSASRLMVYEDGRPLGPAHCAHDEIRRHGNGGFSHWGAQVYFSTSDNSDPQTNGCRYYVREVGK